MATPVEEIKNRLDIVEVISEYTQLRQSCANYRALCLFHSEKAPSFFVSPERQIWHCFGSCNEGGDIFKFVMKIENIEFPEALRILAQKAGVQLSNTDRQAISQRTKLLDIMKLAANFYHLVLLKSSLATQARQYLKDRQLSDDTIKQFQLGFAPDRWDELIQFFVKKKVNLQEAERAGLIMRSNRSRPSQSSHYDRFRNRIMFPINDLYGNPIGFTSRIVPWSTDKETAKYVNTPETPLYNKSHVLYGLDKAKSTIKKENFVIVVEGNVDVIACHQAGSKNIVASSGTALTLDQIKILKRYTPNLYLAFDVDLAGENATQRGIDVALQQEMNVKIIVVPEGKDPDECIKEDPNKWFEAIKNAKPIMEYYFDLALRDRDIKKIEDQKNIVKIILPVIAKFGDPVEQNYWIKFLADKINVPEYSLRDKLKNLKPNRLASKDSKAFTSKATKEQMAAEIFLGLLIKHSQLVIGYFLNLPTEAFVTADAIALAELIQKCYNSGNQDNVIEALQPQLTQNNLVDFFDYLGLLAEKEYPDLTSSTKPKLTEAMKKELTGEVKKLFTILQVEHLKKEKAELSKKLKEAERSKQSDQVKELLDRISQINRIIHQI